MGLVSVLLGLRIVLPILVSSMSGMMVLSASYNFIAQKSCCPDGVPKDINNFICQNLTILDQVNDITTTTNSIRTACAALASSAFGLVRDATGKSKPLIFMGIIAEMMTAATYFVSTIYWSSSPWIPPMVRTFVSGAFGDSIIQLSATCLIIQESSPEELPLSLQVYMTAFLFLMLIGGTLTTMILTTFGYLWLFGVCIAMQIIAFLLVLIMTKEKKSVTKSLKGSLVGLKNVFKWRENVIVLWLMLFAGPITLALFTSEDTNSSTFYQVQLHFSMYETSAYSAYNFLIAIAGSMLVPYVLRKVFHCKDLTLGIIASLMNTVGPVAMAFLKTPLTLYLLALLNFMRLVILPLPNTMISKIVNQDETGTYLGFAAVVTVWVPYSISKIYRFVFEATEKTWIGAYFFLSSIFFFLLALIYSVSYCLYHEPNKSEEGTKSNENLTQDIEIGKKSLEDKNESSLSS